MYRNLLIKSFENKILINNGVKKVIRDGNHVVVVNEKGIMTRYDKVIFASHADETLNMIENLTEEEKRLLSKFKYQKNIATLHTDTSVMPKLKRTWSSWNYIIDKAGYGMKPYTVYYMNKLQQVSDKKDYFVSINGAEKIDARKVLKRIEYDHPVFTVDVLKAQKELPSLNKKEGQLFFCGSYFKYGFHEDAFTSAIELCEKLIDGNIWDITAKNQVSEPAFS
jgi:predicted NAD/FAD-binding protein